MNDIRPCGNNEKWCESCVSKGKCNYTQNTKNQCVIAELESLKAKIDNPKTCMFAGTYEADWIMENIIDKRIAELKGE